MTARRFFRATDSDSASFIVLDPDTKEEIPHVYEADIGDGAGGHVIQFVVLPGSGHPNFRVETTPFAPTKTGGTHCKFKMTMDARDFDIVDRETRVLVAMSRRVPSSLVVESEPEPEAA